MTTKAIEKTQRNLQVLKNLDEISRITAEKFIEIGNQAIKKNGRFAVALAGGTTPQNLYQILASDDFKDRIDWENVFFFFGDERDVSPMSAMSNFKSANDFLFKPLKISPRNVYRWQTEIINAAEVAETYQRTLIRFFKLSNGEFPRFDLILLGMGDDGHTASLFPHTKAIRENSKIGVAHFVEKLDALRLTLTFPTINNAANVIFTISGENKAKALKEVLEGDFNPEKFPAQNVKLTDGNIFWFVDKKASEFL